MGYFEGHQALLPQVDMWFYHVIAVLRRNCTEFSSATVAGLYQTLSHPAPTPSETQGALLPENLCGVIYNIKCGNCDKTYIGETERRF